MRAALFVVLLAACGKEPAQKKQEPTGHQRMLDLLQVGRVGGDRLEVEVLGVGVLESSVAEDRSA